MTDGVGRDVQRGAPRRGLRGFLRRGRAWLLRLHPSRRLFVGYLAWAVAGFAALLLPWTHAEPIRAFDAFFIATATVSTGGLMPYDLGAMLTWPGEIAILLLLQVGGLGYMTLGSFAYLALSDRLGGLTESSLRAGFGLGDAIDLRLFVRSVALFTLACEAAGTLALWWAFARAGVSDPLWQGLFHAVSAFCTAGISLLPDGLVPFRADPWVNGIVVALSLLGALGFLVVTDLWRRARTGAPLGFSSVVILRVFPALVIGGAALLYLTEPLMADLPVPERAMAALFQAANAATTAGFNTVPIGGVGSAAAMVLMALMFIGAAPAGTGGGFKVTSFAALWGLMQDTIMQRRRCTIFGRHVSDERLRLAAASLIAYLVMIGGGVFLLAMLQPGIALGRIGFEVVAALTNAGLSQGVTAELGDAGRAVIAVAMFAGRLGVLTFGLALGFRGAEEQGVEEDLVL